MSWSEWQPGEIKGLGPEGLTLAWVDDSTTVTYPDGVTISGPSTDDLHWPHQALTGQQAMADATTQTSQGFFFWKPWFWDIYRTWWGSALNDLTEDVDYSVIPGKDPWADDAYIEYAAGPNTLEGWDLGNLSIDSNDNMGLGNATNVWGLEIDPDFPREVHVPLGPLYSPPIPLETVVADGTEGYSDVVTDLGAVDSFAFWGKITSYTPGIDTVYTFYATLGPVVVNVRQPAYRYWIPDGVVEEVPMRQRQRDDGLGVDLLHMRGQGTSQQSSIRRGGRIYY